jgi:hypothetical protein
MQQFYKIITKVTKAWFRKLPMVAGDTKIAANAEGSSPREKNFRSLVY